MEREPADGCDFEPNIVNIQRTDGDGIETMDLNEMTILDQHRNHNSHHNNGIIDRNNNHEINNHSSSTLIDNEIENNGRESSNDNNNNDDDDDISYLRCSSLQTEDIQRRRQRQNQRQSSAGYPGLAFGSPMYSNTLFKFSIIANEIKDLKQNQLKKVCIQHILHT